MNKMLKVMLGMFCLFLASSAGATEIARVKLADSITLEGSDQPLVLNGAGIRYKFIFKIYIGALYLPEKMTSAERIIASGGAKRILMHFLYDKVDKKDLDKAWREGFSTNHDEAAMTRLGERIERFSALFGDVREGDEIWLDYLPGRGTGVAINGELKDTIPGEDFFPALLRIWIGDAPVTVALKKSLLGQE